MSRNHRQDPIEGWHHITNHAVGNEDLFLTDTDRYQFIRRMNEAALKHDVTVVAFCLMGNHFHLVLCCPSAGVSRFMHYLESIYAREFNMRHARRGALVASNFFNKLIHDDGQALATVRYVHRNPLELGIDIRTYPWSSYLGYIGEPKAVFEVDESIRTGLLGGAGAHRNYVETDFEHDAHKMSSGRRSMYRSPPLELDESIMQLCRLAAAVCAVSIEEIVAPRTAARNDARRAVVLIVYESRVGFADELRRHLGYRTAVALRSAVNRSRDHYKNDPLFRRLVTELRAAWTPTAQLLAG